MTVASLPEPPTTETKVRWDLVFVAEPKAEAQ